MFIFPKYMKRKLYNEKLLPVIFTLFFAGFYMVWLSTALGFGPGWYFLFPLPFHSGPVGGIIPWGDMQALLFFTGMIIANLSLFVFAYEVFATAYSSKYKDDYNNKPGMNTSMSAKFAGSIGFTSYMPKLVRTRILNYPPAAVAAVVTTIDMIISAPPFTVLLADGALVSMHDPNFLNNLIAKNFLWINYHPIVYFAFFPLIGMYYTLIPIFSKRTFSSSRWLYAPWPLLLISAVGVYSHHLFLDTSQPYILQLTAQNMSMLVSFGSGISVFTLMALIWRSKYEFNLSAKFLVASIFGWVIGGIMGTEQGNAALDMYLHNTYAVVSHFHFNGLDGIHPRCVRSSSTTSCRKFQASSGTARRSERFTSGQRALAALVFLSHSPRWATSGLRGDSGNLFRRSSHSRSLLTIICTLRLRSFSRYSLRRRRFRSSGTCTGL